MLPYEQKQAEISKLQTQIALLLREAEVVEKQCFHTWGAIVYDPIYHKAYTAPGDPPGTMGVDWRGPVHVSAQTIPQWRRQCTKCGFSQTTQRKKQVGGALIHEEPDFG